jgi:hypothetical protein
MGRRERGSWEERRGRGEERRGEERREEERRGEGLADVQWIHGRDCGNSQRARTRTSRRRSCAA